MSRKMMISKSDKNVSHSSLVLNYMRKINKPLSAYEILENVSSRGISAPTQVYRILNKLVKKGLVHKIESLNAWTVCCGIHNDKMPVFEICKNCGNVTEYLDKHLAQSIQSISNQRGFSPDNPILEIQGQCGECVNETQNN